MHETLTHSIRLYGIILEITEENVREPLKTKDVESDGISDMNEEICTLLREAPDVYKNLQDSASSLRRHRAAAVSKG
jgi:hypothetical protein